MAEHIGPSMQQMWDSLGRPEQSPEQTERLIRAVEDAYGSRSYRDLSRERDRKQLAVLGALENAISSEQDEETRS